MKRIMLTVLVAVAASGCGIKNEPAPGGAMQPASAPAVRQQQLVPDDTDDTIMGKPSGLTLYTDFGTGCQYVTASAGGPLTPRLGENGTPLCNPALKRKRP